MSPAQVQPNVMLQQTRQVWCRGTLRDVPSGGTGRMAGGTKVVDSPHNAVEGRLGTERRRSLPLPEVHMAEPVLRPSPFFFLLPHMSSRAVQV